MVRESVASWGSALEAAAEVSELRPFGRDSEVKGTVMVTRLSGDMSRRVVAWIPGGNPDDLGFAHQHQAPVFHLAAGEVSREIEGPGDLAKPGDVA